MHCVSKTIYHPITSNNFNSSCLILVIFGTNITKRICDEKVVYFSPHLFNVHTLPLETLGTWKSKLAVNEHFIESKQVNYAFI